jgi:hypothetical protein
MTGMTGPMTGVIPAAMLRSPVITRLPTGYPLLDNLLGGGWPVGMLTELLVTGHASGELGLLSPALARLTTASWVILVAPPWIPYAPGLCWQGLTLKRVLMVRVRQPPETLWAAEEILRSGARAAVIAWVEATATHRTGHTLLQRLHLLANRQQAWVVLIRSARFRRERSPAPLRLQVLCPSPDTLQLDIFKNGWRGAGTVSVERRF